MPYSIRLPFLLAGLAVLLAACSDPEEAQQEAAGTTEVEQAPAQGADVPAPDNVDAPPPEAETTDTGLAYLVLHDAPSETRPDVQDTVTVHYSGWTTDGKMFDSSVARGEPATFALNQLIPGWQQGITLMTVGDRYRFWIPGELAYDNSTRADAPRGMLVFDVELLGVKEAVRAPENVAAPPANAERSPSGLAWIVLENVQGDVHPASTDAVTVHYSGWTTDGRMFDSSVARGEPATLPLDRLILGWQEALPLMSVGDRYRFWIPGDLAYDNSARPGAPKGMLVFDIKLLGVERQDAPSPAQDPSADGAAD